MRRSIVTALVGPPARRVPPAPRLVPGTACRVGLQRLNADRRSDSETHSTCPFLGPPLRDLFDVLRAAEPPPPEDGRERSSGGKSSRSGSITRGSPTPIFGVRIARVLPKGSDRSEPVFASRLEEQRNTVATPGASALAAVIRKDWSLEHLYLARTLGSLFSSRSPRQRRQGKGRDPDLRGEGPEFFLDDVSPSRAFP